MQMHYAICMCPNNAIHIEPCPLNNMMQIIMETYYFTAKFHFFLRVKGLKNVSTDNLVPLFVSCLLMLNKQHLVLAVVYSLKHFLR